MELILRPNALILLLNVLAYGTQLIKHFCTNVTKVVFLWVLFYSHIAIIKTNSPTVTHHLSGDCQSFSNTKNEYAIRVSHKT